MAAFSFDTSKSFEENLEAFLVEREADDADLAAILRANVATLRTLVTQGERDTKAREAFNAAIEKALDQIVKDDAAKGGK